MPKYAIHHIVLQDAVGRLLSSANAEARQAGTELANDPAYANLGAIGPDLFFWAPDYDIVDKLWTLYQNYDKVRDLYNDIVQPFRDIRDAVVDPVEDAVETLAPSTVALIRQLIEEMRETAKLFKAAVQTGLFAGVIEGADLISDAAGFPTLAAALFNEFRPEMQKGEEENCWYWFEMLHYRRTGDFGRRLVENARGRSARERAYAYGYLSHIGTDLVGHAYVNQVVGGPYRLQVQRHVTAENWMDTWKYQEHYGENINLTLLQKLQVEPSLDSGVGDLLFDTLRDVYAGVDHPRRLPGDGFLSRDQIDETYDVFYKILELMADQGVPRPEEPFSGVGDVLQDALDDLLEPPPSPPPSPSGACSLGDILSFGLTSSSRDCYEEFFEQLADWLDYLADLLTWAFETLLDLLDLLLALLLSLPIVVLLAILYGIQLLLYEIYQAVRTTLALSGFVYPEPRDLNDAHGRNLTTPFLCGLNGCPGTIDSVAAVPATAGSIIYPRLTDLTRSHLVCPNPVPELPVTAPNFAPPGATSTPNTFIQDEPFNTDALAAYADATTPAQTMRLEARCFRVGNATDLTAFMIESAADEGAADQAKRMAHANWNLDSDRGYGFKTWAFPLPAPPSTPVMPANYVGARSRPAVDVPCE